MKLKRLKGRTESEWSYNPGTQVRKACILFTAAEKQELRTHLKTDEVLTQQNGF